LADTKGKLGFALAQIGEAERAETYLTETYPIVVTASQAPFATKQAAYDRLHQGLSRIGRVERVAEFSPPVGDQSQP
jgi:hypothetical protein